MAACRFFGQADSRELVSRPWSLSPARRKACPEFGQGYAVFCVPLVKESISKPAPLKGCQQSLRPFRVQFSMKTFARGAHKTHTPAYNSVRPFRAEPCRCCRRCGSTVRAGVNLDKIVQIIYAELVGVSNVKRSENNGSTDPGVSVRVCH
jgi:hypothetical protein